MQTPAPPQAQGTRTWGAAGHGELFYQACGWVWSLLQSETELLSSHCSQPAPVCRRFMGSPVTGREEGASQLVASRASDPLSVLPAGSVDMLTGLGLPFGCLLWQRLALPSVPRVPGELAFVVAAEEGPLHSQWRLHSGSMDGTETPSGEYGTGRARNRPWCVRARALRSSWGETRLPRCPSLPLFLGGNFGFFLLAMKGAFMRKGLYREGTVVRNPCPGLDLS